MPKKILTQLDSVMSAELLKPISVEHVRHVLTLLHLNSFSLFHSNEIEVVETSKEDYTEHDEQGEIDCLMNAPSKINVTTKICNVEHVIYGGHVIICRSLKYKKTHYVGFYDEHHRIQKRKLEINISNVLIEQRAVDWLVKKFNKARPVIGSNQSNTTVHEQRLKVLEYYLKSRNFDELNSGLDLQAMYENIGSPYKQGLWEQLQKLDNLLFAHGQDDFFKLDYFKEGSPNHKLTLKVKAGGRPTKKE